MVVRLLLEKGRTMTCSTSDTMSELHPNILPPAASTKFPQQDTRSEIQLVRRDYNIDGLYTTVV